MCNIPAAYELHRKCVHEIGRLTQEVIVWLYIDTYIGRKRRAHRGKFYCIGIYEWAGQRERKMRGCEMGRLTQEVYRYINIIATQEG